jgi:hypothetical protein
MRDFSGAFDLSAASIDLSQVVQIIISHTLRSDSTLPSLVPRPPKSLSVESAAVEEQLKTARALLARLQETVRETTMPLEVRAEILKIASCGTLREAPLQEMASRMGHFAPRKLAQYSHQ